MFDDAGGSTLAANVRLLTFGPLLAQVQDRVLGRARIPVAARGQHRCTGDGGET